MTAITTPIPDPIPPLPVPQLAPEQDWSARPVAVAIVLSLLAVGAFIAWRSVAIPDPSAGTAAAPSDLTSTLGWMFEATLTHNAATADGTPVAAPFRSIEVSDVEVVDPTLGPILVTAIGVRPDGTREPLTYEIDVRRRDQGWSIDAVPIDPNTIDPVPIDAVPIDAVPIDPNTMDPNIIDPNIIDPNIIDPNTMGTAPITARPETAEPALNPAGS